MPDPETASARLVESMLDPASYPSTPASVELRETHISWVFLAGERVYKVKKPVVLPFLDYGTPARRHEMCREEIRLNRRLAPRIYLGVVGIAPADGGYRLTDEDDPAAVEYAVEMRRLEEERSLAALAAAGQLEPGQLEAVARRLARFHAEAPAAPGGSGAVDALVATLDENRSTLREAGAGILPGDSLDAAERFTDRFLAGRRGQLEERERAGLVRECHGDLRAEHVIVPVDGEPYVYDCAEFDPALRWIDVAADIAFLVMDLERLGCEQESRHLIDAYRLAGGDPGDDSLLSFLASYRAWVRAKVACLRARQTDERDPERGRRESEARQLLELGQRFAWRAREPLLLVISGMPASGKTTLARRLAERSGWSYVSSDLTRKRLAGIAPTSRAGQEQYSAEMTARTYREMGRSAREELERRGAVLVDATFHRRSERAAFEEGLGERPVPRREVECRASPQTLLARAQRREQESDRVSDADAAVIRRRLAEREPGAGPPAGARLELLTESPLDRQVAEVEAFLDATA